MSTTAFLVILLSLVNFSTSRWFRNDYKYGINGAIAANGYESAGAGAEILRKGGSAVDAAIAVLLVDGVSVPQCSGIGGGFLMTIYSKSNGTIRVLNARETAPANASEDMFKGQLELSAKGGMAVAVPGELRGMWAAHQEYGRLPWKDLFQRAIELCFNGHYVTPFVAQVLKDEENQILASPTLKELFVDPATNRVYGQGRRIINKKLGETLQKIANNGADALYNGNLTRDFVNDIQSMGGIITEDDMKNYQPVWEEPITAKLAGKYKLYTAPPPGSGAILTFILNILDGFVDTNNTETVTNYQRIVESFKFGYAKRTLLGDQHFVPAVENIIKNLTSKEYAEYIRQFIRDNETSNDPLYYGADVSLPDDHGTAHMAILAPDGDAVSVTSTINLDFGAYIASQSTGIILNDEMDDFSSPNITNSYGLAPSPSNYIRPGKRPMSSMAPSIIFDENDNIRLLIGAAGGTKITSSIALVTLRHLLFGYPIKIASDIARIHHQLFPMKITAEKGFDDAILSELATFGHVVDVVDLTGFTALIAISVEDEFITPHFDMRRSGSVAFV